MVSAKGAALIIFCLKDDVCAISCAKLCRDETLAELAQALMRSVKKTREILRLNTVLNYGLLGIVRGVNTGSVGVKSYSTFGPVHLGISAIKSGHFSTKPASCSAS